MKYQIIVNPSTEIQVIDIEIDNIFDYTVTKIPSSTTTTSTTSTTTSTTTTKIPTPSTGYLSLKSSPKIVATSGQIIENLQFSNMSDIAIRVGNGVKNVIIRNCFFNKAGAEAIEIEGAENVTIERCLFYGVTTGVYALGAKTIKVNNNQFVNVRQRRSSSGAIQGRGQFVQFNGVSGAGNEIIGNKGENFAGESDPEDMVSLYASSGTASSPITVRNNMFRGGGPSTSGGGIMSGDNGGSYQLVENNKLLNPGNYIVAIAGGSNITVQNNQGHQSLTDWSNVGGYAYSSPSSVGCNYVKFINNNLFTTSKKYGNNHYYFPTDPAESCKNSQITGNISTITPAQLNFPTHLIDFITPTELLKIRGK